MNFNESLCLARENFSSLASEMPIDSFIDYYFDGWSVVAEIENASSRHVWVKFTLINRKSYGDPFYSALRCLMNIERVCKHIGG